MKQLDYSRAAVAQDTPYNCGPASVQTVVLAAAKKLYPESELAAKLGTHQGGTDYIGQFPKVLNALIPGAQYTHVDLTRDPATAEQKQALWDHIVQSLDAGHGVIANIIAPPSNYPKAVAPSTISPAYGGGVVYHYIAILGYDSERRSVWVADSGFYPYGYWLAFDQLATLIPPKGYAYSAAAPKKEPSAPQAKRATGGLTDAEQREMLDLMRRLHHEATHRFDSRSDLDAVAAGKLDPAYVYKDTQIGYILNIDRAVHDIQANKLPALFDMVEALYKEVMEHGKR